MKEKKKMRTAEEVFGGKIVINPELDNSFNEPTEKTKRVNEWLKLPGNYDMMSRMMDEIKGKKPLA